MTVGLRVNKNRKQRRRVLVE